MALLALGVLDMVILVRALGRLFVVALALSRPLVQELFMGVLSRPWMQELYMGVLCRPVVLELYMEALGRRTVLALCRPWPLGRCFNRPQRSLSRS